MRLQLPDLSTRAGRLIHQTLGTFPFPKSVPSEVKGALTVGSRGQGPLRRAGGVLSLGPRMAVPLGTCRETESGTEGETQRQGQVHGPDAGEPESD